MHQKTLLVTNKIRVCITTLYHWGLEAEVMTFCGDFEILSILHKHNDQYETSIEATLTKEEYKLGTEVSVV